MRRREEGGDANQQRPTAMFVVVASVLRALVLAVSRHVSSIFLTRRHGSIGIVSMGFDPANLLYEE
jgi:hypothetical protein